MFIKITDAVSVAGQIAPSDAVLAARQGFATIVNNRPDGEAPGQPTSAEMAAAAAAAGLGYAAIPIDQSGFDVTQVAAMAAALETGRVLAYCRSGTRSTNLWALAEAKRGGNLDAIVASAAAARYDVAGLLPMMRQLAGG